MTREDTSDLGAGWDAELVSPYERLRRIGVARGLDEPRELRRAHERERVECPRLGAATEAVDPAGRGVLRRPCAQERLRVAAKAVRDRELHEAVSKDGDETEARIVERLDWTVQPTPQGLEEPDLVQTSVSGRGEALELTENSLAGGLGDERRGGPQELLRAQIHVEAELVLEPDRPQQAQRIVDEDRVRHRSNHAGGEIGSPLIRVAWLARSNPNGDRVEREVPRREIRLDPIGKGREVDGLIGVWRCYAPSAMALRERKCGPAETARITKSRLPRIAAGDVEVEHRATEKLVANGSSYDPRLLVAEYLADALIHP